MPRIVPTQVVSAIDRFYPWASTQLDTQQAQVATSFDQQTKLAAIVELVNQVPDEFIVVDPDEYALFKLAVQVITEQILIWRSRGNQGSVRNIPGYGRRHPVAVIRTVLAKCPDEIPATAANELQFIEDDDLRENIWRDISSTNRALANLEWKAATVLAGSCIEALLLWALTKQDQAERQNAIDTLIANGVLNQNPGANDLVNWNLYQYGAVSAEIELIREGTKRIVDQARNFRNLIHPGASQRVGQLCDRGTAYTAVGGLEHVVRDLKQHFA